MTDKTVNRYRKDEVVKEYGITYLRFDMKPVNGVVYTERENGQLWQQLNYEDGGREHTWISLYSKGS